MLRNRTFQAVDRGGGGIPPGGGGEADGRRREDRSDGEKLGSPAGKVGNRNLVGLPAIRGALNLKSGQVNNDQHGTKAFKGQAAGSSLGTFLGSEASLSAFPTLYLFPVKTVSFPAGAGETKQNLYKAFAGLPPPFCPTPAPTERCCMNKKYCHYQVLNKCLIRIRGRLGPFRATAVGGRPDSIFVFQERFVKEAGWQRLAGMVLKMKEIPHFLVVRKSGWNKP